MIATVVWDVDDVLNDLLRTWLEDRWRPRHAACTTKYEDLRENPPHGLLGVSLSEYVASLDEFRLSDLYQDLAPNAAILAWLDEHGERCRHVALTATSIRAAPTTALWVLRHFGRWVREFAFLPAPRAGESLPIYDPDKGAWLAQLRGPRILVDDSPSNIATATAKGTSGVCWPRPWNESPLNVPETLAVLTQLICGAGDE